MIQSRRGWGELKERVLLTLQAERWLLFTVFSLVVFGLIMVYSASFIYAQEKAGDGLYMIKKQLSFAFVGVVALFVGASIPTRKWFEWSYPLLGIALALLALVLIPGVGARVGGAQRWIRLGGFNFQPGELAKFAVLLFTSAQIVRKWSRLQEFVPGVLSHFLVPLPLFLLLLAQPDFGTFAMIAIVIYLLLFLAGSNLKYLGGMLLVGAGAFATLIAFSPYRRARVLGFLDPWSDPGGKGFQIIQSLLGLHEGGLWGVGLGNSKEKLLYLPEAHNDFIFAVIGEELGFIGVCVVILAYCFFVYRGLKVAFHAYEVAKNAHSMLVAASITLALGFQALFNLGVVLGLLPTKGLTLPLVSYGGSALVVDLFMIGVLLAVARESQEGPLPALTSRGGKNESITYQPSLS
jgi:cell division protein FtsW